MQRRGRNGIPESEGKKGEATLRWCACGCDYWILGFVFWDLFCFLPDQSLSFYTFVSEHFLESVEGDKIFQKRFSFLLGPENCRPRNKSPSEASKWRMYLFLLSRKMHCKLMIGHLFFFFFNLFFDSGVHRWIYLFFTIKSHLEINFHTFFLKKLNAQAIFLLFYFSTFLMHLYILWLCDGRCNVYRTSLLVYSEK